MRVSITLKGIKQKSLRLVRLHTSSLDKLEPQSHNKQMDLRLGIETFFEETKCLGQLNFPKTNHMQ